MSQRLCACGCGASLVGRSARTQFLDGRHRQRRYRRRVQAAAKAVGLPDRLTLETVEAKGGRGSRNGDAQKNGRPRQTRRRAGLSVYLPRPELADALLAVLDPIGGAPLSSDDLDVAAGALRKAVARRARA